MQDQAAYTKKSNS